MLELVIIILFPTEFMPKKQLIPSESSKVSLCPGDSPGLQGRQGLFCAHWRSNLRVVRLLWAQLQLTGCNLGLVTSLTLGYFLSKGRLLDSAGLPVPISEDIFLSL